MVVTLKAWSVKKSHLFHFLLVWGIPRPRGLLVRVHLDGVGTPGLLKAANAGEQYAMSVRQTKM